MCEKLVTLIVIYLQLFVVDILTKPYESFISVVNLIERRGYPVEVHANILTEDGYFLDMQRIPHGKGAKTNSNGPPILFSHALFGSADLYVIANNSLTFDLADLGYDVWLLNARGSKYSRNHVNTTVYYNSPYWQYSWHEKGYYDMPACIDFILNKTGYEKIYLFGFSEGTTEFFVLGSDRPEYNDKIRLAINVAPSVYYDGTEFPFLQQLVAARRLLEAILGPLGIKGLYVEDGALSMFDTIQKYLEPIEWVCDILVNLTFLDDVAAQIGFKMATCQLAISGFLHGASLNEIMHYAQIMNARRFQHFDYGSRRNQIKYGNQKPKVYDLSKITCPVALIYVTHDWFAPKRGVNRLAKQLSNVVFNGEIKSDKLLNAHFDYLFRTPVKQKTSQIVKRLLPKY